MKPLHALLAALVFSSSAHAQNSLPAPQRANGVTYLCGGVATEESDAMKAAAKEYDLLLTFATREGSYAADVKLSVEDQAGKSVVDTTCGGPIMLLKFAQAGTYRMRADLAGNAQVKTVQVRPGSGSRSVSFAWPAK